MRSALQGLRAHHLTGARAIVAKPFTRGVLMSASGKRLQRRHSKLLSAMQTDVGGRADQAESPRKAKPPFIEQAFLRQGLIRVAPH